MSYRQVTEIHGVRIIQTKLVVDSRGTFIKFHPLEDLRGTLDSVALTINPNPGTIRGLHFQVEPYAEEKLITCIQGSIFDVAVDIRPESKTFGMWGAIELSAKNALQVYFPKGIAHGYQTLLPNSVVHYGLTSEYSPDSSYVINPFGNLNIEWPIKENLISERDTAGISFLLAAQKYADSIKS